FGDAVDLRGAGAALAGLAIPAHGEVWGLGGLNPVDRVQHHHAFVHGREVILVRPAARVASPDAEHGLFRHHFISSITFFSSSGIGSMARFSTSISPSGARRMTMLS